MKMKKWLWIALLACLTAALLAGTAWAANATVTVDGTFVYRDIDGRLKPIPSAFVSIDGIDGAEVWLFGEIADGVLSIDPGASGMVYGTYSMHISGTGSAISCGANVEVAISEGESVGTVEVPLSFSVEYEVYDGKSGEEIGAYQWTLKQGNMTIGTGIGEVLDSGDILMGSTGSRPWGQYQLLIQKEGYQDASFDITPFFLENGGVATAFGTGFLNVRLAPDGYTVQPTPENLRFSKGVLYWTPSFVGADDPDKDPYIRWCKLVFTDCDTWESFETRISCNNGSTQSYNLFYTHPELPNGEYSVKITALAQPYYATTTDSAPAFLSFTYEKPSGYLPDAEQPAWLEDDFPAMTWGYDPDLLKCVKEFRVIPRFSATRDGWYEDFAHRYLADWQGSLSVAPSKDGVYEIPQLMKAIEANGAGWYTFEVLAVSGSDQWLDGGYAETLQPAYYVPGVGFVKTGMMVSQSNGAEMQWSLDKQSRKLTITSKPEGQDQIFVACYDKNNRLIAITALDASGDTASIPAAAHHTKLIWVGNHSAPLCKNADILH